MEKKKRRKQKARRKGGDVIKWDEKEIKEYRRRLEGYGEGVNWKKLKKRVTYMPCTFYRG